MHLEPKRTGEGHTIDLSSSGISFTTEFLLQPPAEVTLLVTWPLLLEGDVPTELRALGTVVCAEASKAALQMDHLSFVMAG